MTHQKWMKAMKMRIISTPVTHGSTVDDAAVQNDPWNPVDPLPIGLVRSQDQLWLYVQCSYTPGSDPGALSFRHTLVIAPTADAAYERGQVIYPEREPNSTLCNDYVVAIATLT